MGTAVRTSIPEKFCWTRFGTEAGEPIESILMRKEEERSRNGGVFLWGVGNSIRPSVLELLAECESPYVVFSPMLSRPAARDVSPSRTVVWTTAIGLSGHRCDLPAASVVTSAVREGRARPYHFALVCASDDPLTRRAEGDRIRLTDLRNLSHGTAIGSSQVTCVVRHSPGSSNGPSPTYDVALMARLVAPYFVRLEGPREVPLVPSARVGAHTDGLIDELLAIRDGEPSFAIQEHLPLAMAGG